MKNLLKLIIGLTSVLMLGKLSVFAATPFLVAGSDYEHLIPSSCNNSIITGYFVSSGDIIGGGTFSNNEIYVLQDTYNVINGNITVDNTNCIVFVTKKGAGQTYLIFSGNYGLKLQTGNNIYVGGYSATDSMIITNNNNYNLGIYVYNTSGFTLQYLQVTGFSFAGITINASYNGLLNYLKISDNSGYGVYRISNTNNILIQNSQITKNTSGGIYIPNTNYNVKILDNNITNSTNGYGIYIQSSPSLLSGNIISGNTNGIYLNSHTGTLVKNNIITNNQIGIYLNQLGSSSFIGNVISNNQYYGVYVNNSTNNSFVNETITKNGNYNLYLVSSNNNTFSVGTIQYSGGVQLNTSSYNTFSGTLIADTSNGFMLNLNSNYNDIRLANNTNGIKIISGSYNNIWNKQILGQNTISIEDGSTNNTITGGIFTAGSTTNTTVTANLKFNATSPWTYTISGDGISGTYTATVFTGTTTGVIITLTSGTGIKEIIVIYPNGNKQYDSIEVITPQPNGTSNGSNCCGVGGDGIVTSTTGTTTGSTGRTTPLTGGSIVGSPFSQEINQAYLRAYAHGITTMNTIQKANMTGVLTRAHMAKMISVFAVMLANKAPDTSKSCTFNDIANQSTEMKFYINLSCQLGLMGQNITSFDPNGVVTRAQFGTILSRLIRGTTHDTGTPYYANHLNALKQANIITITTPTMKEIRGYVMIMMKRTYEGGFLNN